MKKNKTVAYMLAATLLVGGTFLGTKALFTDKIDVAGELSISTGDVDIEVVGENKWLLDRNGAEYSEGTNVGTKEDDKSGVAPTDDLKEIASKHFANNLKPGDKLEKSITIENKGTLIAEVTLGNNFGEDNSKLGALNGLVKPSQTVTVKGEVDSDGEFTLSPGETAEIKLTLSVDGGGQHEQTATGSNYNADNIENTVVDLTDAWTLDAVQQNPDNKAETIRPAK